MFCITQQMHQEDNIVPIVVYTVDNLNVVISHYSQVSKISVDFGSVSSG